MIDHMINLNDLFSEYTLFTGNTFGWHTDIRSGEVLMIAVAGRFTGEPGSVVKVIENQEALDAWHSRNDNLGKGDQMGRIYIVTRYEWETELAPKLNLT